MKVIDKTPLQDAQGNLGIVQRVQSILEYGFPWQADVEAQKPVIQQLERVLEKGYTLVRNLNLENSKIIEPMILVGPAGVFVIQVTRQPGYFEAKGDEWNAIQGDRRTHLATNPMKRVAKLAQALQVYLNRQGVILPCVVEAVLIAGSPAVHVDVLRPIVRVVLSDAVKQWAAGLLQARPVLRTEVVFDVVDRLLNPRSKPAPLEPLPPQPAPSVQATASSPSPSPAAPSPATLAVASEPAKRARVIFRAAEEAKPFDPSDLDFEFDEQASNEPSESASAATDSKPRLTVVRKGLSGRQVIVLVVMVLVEFGVLAAFLYMILFASR
ncbi:MAG TPA: nuclease-related domain-containing protein [Anaerolineales bacterium]|nr:nuclease-related domain-containing protein [Anaerolineales bacterium]